MERHLIVKWDWTRMWVTDLWNTKYRKLIAKQVRELDQSLMNKNRIIINWSLSKAWMGMGTIWECIEQYLQNRLLFIKNSWTWIPTSAILFCSQWPSSSNKIRNYSIILTWNLITGRLWVRRFPCLSGGNGSRPSLNRSQLRMRLNLHSGH